jgi:ABC-type sugar transport system permease subunit
VSIAVRLSPARRADIRLAYFLILPAAVVIAVVMFVPLFYALFASMYDDSGNGFVFLQNYIAFFRDPVALQALLNTVIYTALNLVLCLVLGVGMAVVLASLPLRLGNTLRAVFSMPLLISPIIVALIWRYMYDPQYGIVYWLLSLVGLDKSFGGLSQPATALICVCIADVWNVTPFIMLVVSAGLTTIPGELYEAARIDGAGATRSLFSITLPLLTKVLAVVTLIRGTDAFRVFDIIYGTTNGGPANSTYSLSLFAYKAAYQNNEMGYGMAVSIITLIALIILFSPLMRNTAQSREDLA